MSFKTRFASHLVQNGALQSAFRESFGSEQGFKARFASHLVQNGASSAFREFDSKRGSSELVSRLIWFRRALQSAFRESFGRTWFKARFASHLFRTGSSKRVFASNLIQNGDSKRVSRVIWFRAGLQARFASHLIQTGLQIAFRESFKSEWGFKARFASHLVQNGDSKRVSRVIWFRTGFKARFANHWWLTRAFVWCVSVSRSVLWSVGWFSARVWRWRGAWFPRTRRVSRADRLCSVIVYYYRTFLRYCVH